MYRTFIVLVISLNYASCIYLPGLKPKDYCKSSSDSFGKQCTNELNVYVNNLSPTTSLLSRSYESFDFCKLDDKDWPVENLGQVIFGERLRPSNYKINFDQGDDSKCLLLCRKTYDKVTDLYKGLRDAVIGSFAHFWVADNLPVVFCMDRVNKKRVCSTAIPLGCFHSADDLSYSLCYKLPATIDPILFNHYDFHITYHVVQDSWSSATVKDAIRIVSVVVQPRSIKHDPAKLTCTQTDQQTLPGNFGSPMTITYSYSYTFTESKDIKWSSRWDYMLESLPRSEIRWFSILSSVVMALFLSMLLAIILLRTLRRDIARYSQLDEELSEIQEESGWKLVHGDVFRPPQNALLISVFVGSGVQIFAMLCITLFFACLGFLSPAHRGAFLTCALALFVCLGTPAGFTSARVYKLMGGLRWKTNVLLTATLCPGVTFTVVLILNTALGILHSATAIPVGTIFGLLAMWIFVSLPLCFVGAFFGFSKGPIEVPVRTNQIPRQIPLLSTYSRSWAAFWIGGLFPFGCLFIQLFFIFNSLWGSQFYFVFGFLFVVFAMLVITCAVTSMLLVYFQLCAEDYRWWWRPFYAAGGLASYIFIYSLHYFVFHLNYRDSISGFLYFGYTSIIIWLIFLFTGSVGFLATLWFICKIYSVVKVD